MLIKFAIVPLLNSPRPLAATPVSLLNYNMARNLRHVFSCGLHSHLLKMALAADKSGVTRAHSHDTNGRVKHNDVYA